MLLLVEDVPMESVGVEPTFPGLQPGVLPITLRLQSSLLPVQAQVVYLDTTTLKGSAKRCDE
jgi:hypothetical protein